MEIILKRPNYCLEPMGIDYDLIVGLKEVISIKELKNKGISILSVENNKAESNVAVKFRDRIVCILKGNVVFVGSPLKNSEMYTSLSENQVSFILKNIFIKDELYMESKGGKTLPIISSMEEIDVV